MELYELISHLRNLINDTRKQSVLLQSSSKWNMLCASLDAIEDARAAIRAYTEQAATDDVVLPLMEMELVLPRRMESRAITSLSAQLPGMRGAF